MGTDFTLDDVYVDLPNSTTSGFSKMRCKRGDWVMFTNDSGGLSCGRSIGRIKADGRVFIYVAALGSDLTFLMVRWVHPSDVKVCLPIERGPHIIKALLITDFSKLENIRRLMEPQLSHKLSFGDKDRH